MNNRASKIDVYDIWQKYERSNTYMHSKGIKEKTEKNWNFYIGNQWENVKNVEGLDDLPTLNFIKQTVKYKVSTIAQHSVTAIFSDLNSANRDVCSRLEKLFEISWDRAKMNRTAWKTLLHSSVQGDSYTFWGSNDTRKPPQIVHNTQMRLGDENTTDIQDQPYIIIEERLTRDVIRERARLQGISEDDLSQIIPDDANDEQLMNTKEVSSKVTSLLYMEKIDGIVWIARATKTVMYEPPHPIAQTKAGESLDKGLTLYPVIPMIWEETPNNARGTSEVEQLIPNQFELNKLLARRAISAKMTAFPRIAVDDTALQNPEALDKVGAVIKLNGGNAQNIQSMISYLSPQSQSPDASTLTNELLERTKDLAGASDTALGNIDLSRVSGTAATTIRDQQQVPLNEQVSIYQEYVENVALLWFELWRVYYPQGIEMDGIYVGADEIENLVPNVRIDISEDTTLSRMATQQEIMNMFNNNKITFEEMAQAYPEHANIDKNVLMGIVEGRKIQQQQQQAMMQQQQAMMQGNGEPTIDNDVNEQIPDQDVGNGGMSAQQVQSMVNGGQQ